jgi:hypothetical protein
MMTNKDDSERDVETVDLGDEYDSLDDVSRRQLLSRLRGIGATAVPISMLFLDANTARAGNTGSDCEGLGC